MPLIKAIVPKDVYKRLVTGINVPKDDESIRFRRDIEEWSNSRDPIDKDQVNLFLIALKEMQDRDEKDPDSYFMLAAIHGVPGDTEVDGKKRTGDFCTHGSILFPAWHRPYLALYEKLIWDIMNKNARLYDDKDRYIEAAKSWRLPYYDPAKIVDRKSFNGLGIPSLCTWPTRDVLMPDGEWVCIRNPLYSYIYHGREEALKWDKENRKGEMEHFDILGPGEVPVAPTTEADVWQGTQEAYNRYRRQANQNNYHILELFREDSSLRRAVYDSLIYTEKFVDFATTVKLRGSRDDSTDASLEDSHNTIHDYCGGLGHMGQVPIAAFDPIFWLHHTNIDRWFAIWEKLHPGSDSRWTEEEAMVKNPAGEWVEGDKPDSRLYPFITDKGNYWTPETVRDLAKTGDLGHTYKELRLSNKQLKQELGRMYGALSEYLRRKPVMKALQARQEANIDPAIIQFDDYLVTAKFERFALDGAPFEVHFFLGEFNKSDPSNWKTCQAHLGMVFNFVSGVERGEHSNCENCENQRDAKAEVAGQASLTQAIIEGYVNPESTGLDLGKIMDRKTLLKYLTDHLHWRVTKMDGTKVPRDQVKGLMVEVRMREGTIKSERDNYDPPEFGPWGSPLYDITDGRPGGAKKK